MKNWTKDQSVGCKENPGVEDTGNGAMRYHYVNPAFPGVQYVVKESYCGRDSDNEKYFLIVAGDKFCKTLAEVKKALRQPSEA